MAPRARKNKADPLADLPEWARKLAERYYTKTVSTFLVHGNVRDLEPITQEDGSKGFGTLKAFFAEELFGARDHVLFYDRSSGIRGATPETQADISRAMSGYDSMYGTDFAKVPPRDPGRALQLLENYFRLRLADGKSIALVIDFAETLAPASELGNLSAEDRFSLVTLVKWANDPQLLAGDVSIILVAENLSEVSPKLSRNPYVATIALPLPNEDERLDYIKYKLESRKLPSISDIPIQGFAKMTAGLSRINLDRIMTEAIERGVRISPELLKDRKKEIGPGLLQAMLDQLGLAKADLEV